MKSAKRFLSVILAVILVCSTLVIGASAAYNAYKGDAIKNSFNELDKPVLTTDQYASAAMDEIDRMLAKEDMVVNVYIGTLDITSVDKTFDSVYSLVTSRTFELAGGLIGDLGKLSANALRPESEGGVRRGTAGKSDIDMLYALLEFLHDNKQIFVDLVNGNLNMGSLLDSLLGSLLPPELDIKDISGLLKGMLIPEVYGEDDTTHTKDNTTYDQLAQDAIDMAVLAPDVLPQLEGYTNISTGSMYGFLDNLIKVLYNTWLLDIINTNLSNVIKEFCGVKFIKSTVEETVVNPDTGLEETKLVEKVEEDRSNLNSYANLLNIDYVAPEFTFSDETFISNLNNIIKSLLDVIIRPDVFVWQAGDNSVILNNIISLAKKVLVSTGDEFFPSYIKLATPEEINAMTDQEVVAYILRVITNAGFKGAYIPDDATTSLDVAFYAMEQLLATEVPQLDFSGYDHTVDSIMVMLANYGVNFMEEEFALGLEYVTDMDGVNAQLQKAMNWVIDNFGGALNGIKFDKSASGWDNLNKLLFSILDPTWLPASINGDIYTFVMDIVDSLVALDFDAIFDLFVYRSDSELQKTPKQVIINLVVRVVNMIFPGAMTSVPTLEALLTNAKLATLVGAIFETLWVYRKELCTTALPIVCELLDLTSEQSFKFPTYTYDRMFYDASGAPNVSIGIRNGSTGINTGYTDKDGNFHLDQLYTYDFKSVTSNAANIKLTNPGKLAAGESGEIKITGSITSQTFIVTVTYDILTEDGTPLTDEPITENLYSYFATGTASDEKAEASQTSGDLTVYGIKNLYASSMDDIEDYTIEIRNNGATRYENNVTALCAKAPAMFNTLVNYTGKVPVYVLDEEGNKTNKFLYDENGEQVMEDYTVPKGSCYVQLRDDVSTLLEKIEDNKGATDIKLFETTEEYDALDKYQKQVVWEAMCQPANTRSFSNKQSKIAYGAKIGGTAVAFSAGTFMPYNDFDLYSLLDSEITRHRLASGYSSTAAWNTYISAMTAAVEAAYGPFSASTFANLKQKASKYESAAATLEAAIENLEEYVTSEGVGSTQAIIDSVNPSNTIKTTDDAGVVTETQKDYDDPTYSFFGGEDYVKYTYKNYRDKYKTAQKMIDKATIPDEDGNVQVISDLDIAYNNHRLELYAGRLHRTLATTLHLDRALAANIAKAYVSTDYTTESWANYQRALTFAQGVAAEDLGTADEPLLKQSKINVAYNELLEAEKRLTLATGGATPDEPTIDIINPDGDTAPVVFETLDGFVLAGVYVDDSVSIESYFNLTGCTVEAEANENGMMSTGATVTIKNSATGAVIATYQIAVTGDINGDGTCDGNDAQIADKVELGIGEANGIQSVAGDTNLDDLLDGNDGVAMNKVELGIASIDYANRCLA